MAATVHDSYVEKNARRNGSRAICSCGWHAGWGSEADAARYAARHRERPDVNPIYPPREVTYDCDAR